MPNLIHVGENSGLKYFESTEPVTGKTIIRSEQDVQPVLDEAARQRATGERDKGIAGHMKHYCYLPNGVALELLKKGINMQRPQNGDWARFFKEIETNYPYLKTTEKKAWRPS